MEMERRGEQSISLSMSCIAEMATPAVTNRVKGGQIKRGGKESKLSRVTTFRLSDSQQFNIKLIRAL